MLDEDAACVLLCVVCVPLYVRSGGRSMPGVVLPCVPLLRSICAVCSSMLLAIVPAILAAWMR